MDEETKNLTRECIERTDKNKSDNQRDLDTMLITLTGGAFAISITFFTAVADKLIYIPVLLLTWSILAATLIFQIFTFVECIDNDIDLIKKAQKFLKGEIEYRNWLSLLAKIDTKNNNINKANRYVAWGAIGSIVLMVVYGIFNVIHIRDVNQTHNEVVPTTVNHLYITVEK